MKRRRSRKECNQKERVSCLVSQLEGCLVVEGEAVRSKKREKENQRARKDGRSDSDAEVRSVPRGHQIPVQARWCVGEDGSERIRLRVERHASEQSVRA